MHWWRDNSGARKSVEAWATESFKAAPLFPAPLFRVISETDIMGTSKWWSHYSEKGKRSSCGTCGTTTPTSTSRGLSVNASRAGPPRSWVQRRIIQSNFRSGNHGNFEVVVPVINNAGRVDLQHYWHDNSDVNKPWSLGQRINNPAHEVIGGGCIIQSNFGSRGNFEIAAVGKTSGRSLSAPALLAR
jgi:hypothetical protein